MDEVAICNAALYAIGATPIDNFDESTDAARICKARWPKIRDAVLRAHKWNCATRRAELARLAAAPAFGWSYQYQLPVDCVRVLEMSEDVSFLVENGVLLTDNSTAKIKYISNGQPAGDLLSDALLDEAFAARMAAELAVSLKQSKALHEQMLTTYGMKISEAAGIDGMEGTPADTSDDTLIADR